MHCKFCLEDFNSPLFLYQHSLPPTASLLPTHHHHFAIIPPLSPHHSQIRPLVTSPRYPSWYPPFSLWKLYVTIFFLHRKHHTQPLVLHILLLYILRPTHRFDENLKIMLVLFRMHAHILVYLLGCIPQVLLGCHSSLWVLHRMTHKESKHQGRNPYTWTIPLPGPKLYQEYPIT